MSHKESLPPDEADVRLPIPLKLSGKQKEVIGAQIDARLRDSFVADPDFWNRVLEDQVVDATCSRAALETLIGTPDVDSTVEEREKIRDLFAALLQSPALALEDKARIGNLFVKIL